MDTLPPAAWLFIEQLVAAHDPASLYKAFEIGLGAVFSHHSFVSSFAFERATGGPMSVWSCPSRPEHTPDWWALNAQLHPGFNYVRDKPGLQVCRCSDALSDELLECHPYYKTFVEPEGYRYAMAILVWDEGQVVGYVAVNRAREQGDFTEAERELARALHPFVAAAYRRIARTRVNEDARHAQEALLATLPIATVVYSARDRRVLFHNRASKDALAHWRGEAGLKRPRAVRGSWIPEEIASACASLPAEGAEVACPRGGLRAVLRRMDPRAHFASDVVLIVIDEDEGPPPESAAGWLRAARVLTHAEQAVAKLAAGGLANTDIARRLGKSPLTVKKQLESIFAKMNVANRAELVSVLAGFRAPRGRPSASA